MAVKTRTDPDPPTDPDPEPDPEPSDAHLREVIREELKKLIPGGLSTDPDPDPDPEPEPDEGNLTLRQITDRALKLTASALDRIPGQAPKEKEPDKPAPEKKPISRSLKALGFVIEE